ncbi:MAG: hypothetical protein B6D64_00925 [Bacteroidetes bacterium 4484_276]|nr:MAG: hypothetical protein B6D64_00925 [Bacteroidetes bacterium 4484_276]OYT13194.1 MAG: hypothetical protein B6I19_06385 [Bacteroidetes bacterium 4572_114]
MKTLITTIAIWLSATVLYGQSVSPEVIATSGGYFENAEISLSWTLGETVTETFSSGNVTLTQGFQQPYNFYLQQILNIPVGWSGVSTYLDLQNKGVESIFDPYQNDLIIMASMTDFYYPAQQVNTIGNWDYNTGYQIKAENGFELSLSGSKIANPVVEIYSPGWGLLPVLTSCEVPVADVLFDGSEQLQLVKQVAGPLVFWPEYGINTLQTLLPGKAYFVISPDVGVVTFPECSKSSPANRQEVRPLNFSPWNDLHYTAVSHVIAFPADVLAGSGIMAGDAIGVFTPDGLCAGRTKITNILSGAVVTAFGNDETTLPKDGFGPGEMLTFKVFRPSTNQGFNLEVGYVPSLPNAGIFATHGLSAADNLKLQHLGVREFSGFSIQVFPNPSNGNFNLALSHWPQNLEVYITDIKGSIHKVFTPGKMPNGSIYNFDLSFLPRGMYFLKLVDGSMVGMRKIVVQK